MTYADGAMLILDDGTRWGPFTSHWAAVAAMIRTSNPEFRSIGRDKDVDLAIERDIKTHREGRHDPRP